jgi:hypothetical protein
VRGGPRSRLARDLGHPRIWGKRLDSETCSEVVAALLKAAASYRIVRPVSTSFDVEGWRLAANALRLFEGEGRPDERPPNPYFVSLYRTLADALASGAGFLFGQEGREHTAQVDQERRQWREWRFRWGAEDRERLAGAKDTMRQVGEPGVPLPALFCSPTMELGVDISALNAVYLRNMPPTPANYAQRSGRAGRSGQAALVVAYCAAQGPHDQYYFERPQEMVSGIVRPPAIELANRDLVRAHLHAIWLAESGKELAAEIPLALDLSNETLPVQEEIADAFAEPNLNNRSGAAMKRVLNSIGAELTKEAAPWAADRKRLRLRRPTPPSESSPTRLTAGGSFIRERGISSRKPTASRNCPGSGPMNAKRQRTSKLRRTSSSRYWREARRAAARISTHTVFSQPKASCLATTFRGCRSMPMCRRSARGRAGEPPISSGRGFSRSPNSGRGA